jgi:hypothetical protein
MMVAVTLQSFHKGVTKTFQTFSCAFGNDLVQVVSGREISHKKGSWT